MKRIINENSPRGHYSPGILCGNLLFVSGQTSADPATGFPPEGGFESEVLMALRKMESVLLAANCTKENVIKCSIFLTSMENWSAANTAYAQFFGDHRPARIVLPVGPLTNGCQVELDIIAEIP